MAIPQASANHAQYAEQIEAQRAFLQSGGIYRAGLAKMRADGTLPSTYVYQEYPKMLPGEIVVQDAEEEARVLAHRGLSPAPQAAADDDESIEALERRLADMKRKAELRRQIAEAAAQEAAEAAPVADAASELREDLMALGVKPDPKWDVSRLHKEVERATAKGA